MAWPERYITFRCRFCTHSPRSIHNFAARELMLAAGDVAASGVGNVMRSPVYDLYQMKPERLPKGARSAWLRTRPNEPPPAPEDWIFVGKERHPSKWTVAEMNEKGRCYREIPSWLSRRPGAASSPSAENSAA